MALMQPGKTYTLIRGSPSGCRIVNGSADAPVGVPLQATHLRFELPERLRTEHDLPREGAVELPLYRIAQDHLRVELPSGKLPLLEMLADEETKVQLP